MLLIIDTCVWLNMIEITKMSKFIHEIKEYLDNDQIGLLVPDIVMEEIDRNLDKVKDIRLKHFRGKMRSISEIKEIIPSDQIEEFMKMHDIVNYAIEKNEPKMIEDATIIREILNHKNAIRISTTDEVKFKVYELGRNKKCPFHTKENSVGDATILELTFDYLRKNPKFKDKSEFITVDGHFQDKSNPKEPHQDIKEIFDEIGCSFSINIAESLNKVTPGKFDALEVKEIHDMTSTRFYFDFSEDVPKLCTECDTKLPYGMYRNLNGAAGWLIICPKCGKQYFEMDPNY